MFQKVLPKLFNDKFYTTLTSLIGYLCRQFTFISEVGIKCPTVATIRWLSLGRVLKWLVWHCAKVMNYIDKKNPSCRPSMSWLIAAMLMHGVTAKVDMLFNSLQAKQLLIRQQIALFDDFVSRLRELVGVIGTLTDAQIRGFGINDLPRLMSLVDAGIFFGVSVEKIVAFRKGRGSFTMVEYANFDAESAASLVDLFRALLI